MSASDPVAVILGGLDRPVQPRPEFAEALLSRLLEELGEGLAPSGLRRVRFTLPRLLPGAPPRLRLALIVIAVLLLLAGIATATFFGVRTWVSAGPRGVQFTNDFQLVELAVGDVGRAVFSPDGDELYGTRVDSSTLEDAVLVRVTGLREERLRAAVAVHFRDLRDPALWDPGTDLGGTVVPELFGESGWMPAVSESGEVALVASVMRARTLDEYVRTAPASTALLVRHADGRVEKVLTFRQLVAAGILDRAALSASRGWIAVAFPAEDRIVLHVQDRGDRLRFRSFYEIVDPNGDGDWSDREVAPLRLPEFLGFDRPVTEPTAAWYPKRLAVEPSAGEDGSAPFLLAVKRFGLGELRVYRVLDRNGDGDARDAGEFEPVFSGTPTGPFDPGVIAPRRVVRDGTVVLSEVLLGGFTTQTRVSRVSESGEVTDIARAFSRIESAGADTDGNVYVIGIPPDSSTSALFKLKPVPVGESPAPRSAPSTAPAETAPAVTEPGPPPPVTGARSKIPRLAVTRSLPSNGTEIFVLRADGRRLRTIASGASTYLAGPQSPDGSRIVYTADEEIPNEPFTYVARLDGRQRTKIAETVRYGVCWLSKRSLLLQAEYTLSRYDLVTGRDKPLLKNASAERCTADGRFVPVTRWPAASRSGPTGPASIELLDLRTQERRMLAGPPAGGGFSDWHLARDGSRLAYVVQHLTGPPNKRRETGEYTAYLKDVSTAKITRVLRLRRATGVYSTWSPTSDRLVLSIARRAPCTGAVRYGDFCQSWSFALVGAEGGKPKTIVSGLPDAYLSVVWSPDGKSLAYSTGKAVHLVAVDGATRKLPQGAGWAVTGWSPDGRYLGLQRTGPKGVALAVLDVTTGKVRVLLKQKGENVFLEATWLR